MLPVRYCCLITVVGGELGHAPSKTLLSYNCGRGKLGHAPSKTLLSYNCGWG